MGGVREELSDSVDGSVQSGEGEEFGAGVFVAIANGEVDGGAVPGGGEEGDVREGAGGKTIAVGAKEGEEFGVIAVILHHVGSTTAIELNKAVDRGRGEGGGGMGGADTADFLKIGEEDMRAEAALEEEGDGVDAGPVIGAQTVRGPQDTVGAVEVESAGGFVVNGIGMGDEEDGESALRVDVMRMDSQGAEGEEAAEEVMGHVLSFCGGDKQDVAEERGDTGRLTSGHGRLLLYGEFGLRAEVKEGLDLLRQ
jgi:hypothetical protein